MSANSIDDIPVGLGTRVTKTVSESDVHLFAGITGDLDPNHVDEEYCRGNARLGRSRSKTSGTLAGVRILAFTQFLLGPAACQHLAHMGADVIKIEPPGRGAWERRWSGADTFIEGVSAFFMLANRNLRSMTLNLRSALGVDISRRLAYWCESTFPRSCS
jgi:hypothetical protein